MHQHPRPSVTAPPTSPPRPSSTRFDRQRDQDAELSRPSSNAGSDTTRGLGIDAGVEASEQEQKATPAKEAMAKLNQIISVGHSCWLPRRSSRVDTDHPICRTTIQKPL